MNQTTLNSMTFDSVLDIHGNCASVSMSIRDYIGGGWLDTDTGHTDDFDFTDGGYITIQDDQDNEEFGLKAIFVDEFGVKEDFTLMF